MPKPEKNNYFAKNDIFTVVIQVEDVDETMLLMDSLHDKGLVAGCRVIGIHRADLFGRMVQVEGILQNLLDMVSGEKEFCPHCSKEVPVSQLEKRDSEAIPGEKYVSCPYCGLSLYVTGDNKIKGVGVKRDGKLVTR